MKNKKSASANLENKRIIFFQIGIILSLALALTAFEWRSYDEYTIEIQEAESEFVEELDIPATVIPEKPKPIPRAVTVIIINDEEPIIEEEELVFVFETNPEQIFEKWSEEIVEEEIIEDPIPILDLDEMPEFPGGYSALMRFLAKNIKYPTMAVETGVQGRVYVSFVVEKDGSITDVKMSRGIGGGCDEEAIRVVKLMPRWKPGKQHFMPVRVQYSLPVRFILQN